jgi:hypothetical protein
MKVLILLLMILISGVLSALDIEDYRVKNHTETADLFLSGNNGNVIVKAYKDSICDPHPLGAVLARIDNENDFTNPVHKKIEITSDPGLVITFLYNKRSPISSEYCPVTLRVFPVKGKKYHAYFEYKDGLCSVEFLTLVDDGKGKENWQKYRFAKINEHLCLDQEDIGLQKRKLPIKR